MPKLDYAKFKIKFTADFETSTEAWNIEKARVWLWDICNINSYTHTTGKTIESFIEAIKEIGKRGYENVLLGFHNLAYDGIYLLNYLLENGFKGTADETPKTNEIFTLITKMGQHYCYVINFGQLCRFHKPFTVTIVDTYKTIHMSVEKIAEAYKLPILKGSIDYDLFRPENYDPNETEIAYIQNDTEIIARALQENFKLKLTKVTQPANAFSFYKKTIGKEQFDAWFPVDEDFTLPRQAYFGGMCYANPKYQNKDLYGCKSYDINSMYPSAMLHALLPYGRGIFGHGNALNFLDELGLKLNENCVYVQRFMCAYELKPNHIPILFKSRYSLNNDLHSTSSNYVVEELILTHTDIEMLFENYDVAQVEYLDFVIYNAQKGYTLTRNEIQTLPYEEIIEKDGKGSMFYDYVKYWRQVKENSTGARRENAKFMQNMLYGNFGKNIDGTIKIPYIEDEQIKFVEAKTNNERVEYVPIACFITAWCRYFLVKDILKNIDNFIYCDTDSLYLIDKGETPDLTLHQNIYGAYKLEHLINRIRVIGSKRYIYDGSLPDGSKAGIYVTCCGADNNIKQQLNFENFYAGLEVDGKKQVKTVKGGKHITKTTYKIKGR